MLIIHRKDKYIDYDIIIRRGKFPVNCHLCRKNKSSISVDYLYSYDSIQTVLYSCKHCSDLYNIELCPNVKDIDIRLAMCKELYKDNEDKCKSCINRFNCLITEAVKINYASLVNYTKNLRKKWNTGRYG